jgi:SulP family sulfate permease
LLFVAWNMGEWHEFVRLRQFSNHYRLLLLGTFVLTVVLDLMVAVEVGLALSCLLFVRRMATLFRATPLAQDGPAQLAWTLHGVLFFGATARLDELEDAINQAPQGVQVLLDLSDLLSLDTTGVDALEQLLKAAEQRGGRLRIRGAQPQVQSLLERSGLAAKLGEATPP